jgi:hypothetical protein
MDNKTEKEHQMVFSIKLNSGHVSLVEPDSLKIWNDGLYEFIGKTQTFLVDVSRIDYISVNAELQRTQKGGYIEYIEKREDPDKVKYVYDIDINEEDF